MGLITHNSVFLDFILDVMGNHERRIDWKVMGYDLHFKEITQTSGSRTYRPKKEEKQEDKFLCCCLYTKLLIGLAV